MGAIAYRMICILDGSVQDSETNTLCSFAAVSILGMTGADVRAGSGRHLLKQQTLIIF